MLKTIVHPSVKLVEFIFTLKLALYQPQIKHLERLVDALIVCDRSKTLTNLYREFVEELDPNQILPDCFHLRYAASAPFPRVRCPGWIIPYYRLPA
jgi:hypothetical protein